MTDVTQLRAMLAGKKRVVFFGGAGVSTESGIPDFRGTDGLYHQQWAYPPETILSHEEILHSEGVPHCPCGGIIKPEVVLYGEPLDPQITQAAQEAIDRADLLLIGGTSLSVYPAAWYVADYPGPIVMLNRTPTAMDRRASLLLTAPIGETLGELMGTL